MAEQGLFDKVAEEIERQTGLARLVARGALRKALKEAGLDSATTDANQMVVVIEKVMPNVLKRQGISNEQRVCTELGQTVKAMGRVDSANESPEATFRRLTAR